VCSTPDVTGYGGNPVAAWSKFGDWVFANVREQKNA